MLKFVPEPSQQKQFGTPSECSTHDAMVAFSHSLRCHLLVAACGLASAVSAGVLRSRVTEGVEVTYKEVSCPHKEPMLRFVVLLCTDRRN